MSADVAAVPAAGRQAGRDDLARRRGAVARRVLSVRKVGHAGTLDPMATGLLVLGVGAATRLLGYLSGSDKTYDATIRLGQSTVTDDAEGEVTATTSAAAVAEDDVRAALAAQVGDAAAGARRRSARSRSAAGAPTTGSAPGEEFELAARSVTVHRIDVHRIARPTPDLVDVDVTVSCSTGTYVRAIARDVGAALGVGGHLTALRRTSSGPVRHRPGPPGRGGRRGARRGRLRDRASWGSPTPPARSSPARELTAEEAVAVGHGQRVPATGAPGLHAAVAPDGRLVALVEDAGQVARVAVGFPPR